MVIDYQ